MLRRQQISLSRVLARQDGKTPSEAFYDEKRKDVEKIVKEIQLLK